MGGANLQVDMGGHGSLTCTSGSVASIGGGGTLSKPYVGDCQVQSGSVTAQPAHPSWCKWVPAASQEYVTDCSPQSSQQPSHWCQWVPEAAKQYVADCAGVPSPSVTPSAGSPSWCRWVPADAQHNVPDCSGLPTSNSQGSASWCKWVPAS